MKSYAKNLIKVLFFGIFLTCINLRLSANTVFADTNVNGSVVDDVHATYALLNTSPEKLKSIQQIAASDPNVQVTVRNGIIDVDFYMPVSDKAELTINGDKVPIKNGIFSLNFEKNVDKINYMVKDINTDMAMGNQTIDNSHKTVRILNIIDFNALMDAMDSMNEMSSDLLRVAKYPGQKYNGEYVSAGTPVHCNRFNGPHSNHRYYSRKSGDIQEATNWYKSDCFDKWHAYGCPLNKADNKCQGLLKHGAHNCSRMGGWPIRCWYRN